MTHSAGLRRLRALPTPVTGAVILLGVAGLVAAAFTGDAGSRAGSTAPAAPAQPANTTQIPNVDQVKAAVRAYYGDTTTAPRGAPHVDPVTSDHARVTLHYPSAGSAYDKDLGRITSTALTYLAHPGTAHPASARKAIVLDVDDTTLNTYNYEIYANFAPNTAQKAAFVNSRAFPAVFHMLALARTARAEGYTIFFLTGRGTALRTGTLANLRKVGYPVVNSRVYLKDLTNRIYRSCYVAAPTPRRPTCTTRQYKSLTRRHIESLGYDIKANFGDQYSDLSGGYADRTFKLPNPMYYLP